MNRITQILLAFILAASPVIAQKSITLLKEDFKNNHYVWPLRNDTSFLVDIKNGVLHLEKFRKNFIDRGCLWYRKEIEGFNTLEDFSVTVFAKNLHVDDVVDMFDIQWGTWSNIIASKATRIYQLNFMFSRGEVKLDYFNQKWDYSLRKATKEIADKNLYRPKEINKYEIIQQNGFVIFNVNDKPYFKQFAAPVAGNSIGFQGCLKAAWEIDKVIVKQFKKEKEVTAAIALTLPAVDTLITSQNQLPVSVYPNPFKDEITVQFMNEKESIVKIECYDMNGRAALQYQNNLPAGEQRIRLYADIAPGAYVIKLTIGDKSSSVKAVKQ